MPRFFCPAVLHCLANLSHYILSQLSSLVSIFRGTKAATADDNSEKRRNASARKSQQDAVRAAFTNCAEAAAEMRDVYRHHLTPQERAFRFFNREYEASQLRDFLSDTPSVLFLYGPGSAGKTSFLQKNLMLDMDAEGYEVFAMDLRGPDLPVLANRILHDFRDLLSELKHARALLPPLSLCAFSFCVYLSRGQMASLFTNSSLAFTLLVSVSRCTALSFAALHVT